MRCLFVLLFVCQFAQSQIVNRFVKFGDNLGPELYTVANALSRAPNEADAVTGLGTPSGGTITSIESSPSPQDGTSVIKFVETSAPDRVEVAITLENGATYQIEYFAWEESGNGIAQIWLGFVSSPNQSFTTTPTLFQHTLTTNATDVTLRWFANIASTTIFIDGLSIKKVL